MYPPHSDVREISISLRSDNWVSRNIEAIRIRIFLHEIAFEPCDRFSTYTPHRRGTESRRPNEHGFSKTSDKRRKIVDNDRRIPTVFRARPFGTRRGRERRRGRRWVTLISRGPFRSFGPPQLLLVVCCCCCCWRVRCPFGRSELVRLVRRRRGAEKPENFVENFAARCGAEGTSSYGKKGYGVGCAHAHAENTKHTSANGVALDTHSNTRARTHGHTHGTKTRRPRRRLADTPPSYTPT